MKNVNDVWNVVYGDYTLEECSCEYCLFYQGPEKDCIQEVCCCAEEKEMAMEREASAWGN